MDTRSLAHPAPGPTTRAARALRLYEERGHEIERLAEDLYRVPSCTGHSVYTVRYGDVEACECPDFLYGGGRSCKHLLAVGIAHAKKRFTTVRTIDAGGDPFAYAATLAAALTAEECAECGVSVAGPDEGVVAFNGEVLCHGCTIPTY